MRYYGTSKIRKPSLTDSMKDAMKEGMKMTTKKPKKQGWRKKLRNYYHSGIRW